MKKWTCLGATLSIIAASVTASDRASAGPECCSILPDWPDSDTSAPPDYDDNGVTFDMQLVAMRSDGTATTYINATVAWNGAATNGNGNVQVNATSAGLVGVPAYDSNRSVEVPGVQRLQQPFNVSAPESWWVGIAVTGGSYPGNPGGSYTLMLYTGVGTANQTQLDLETSCTGTAGMFFAVNDGVTYLVSLKQNPQT